MNVIVRSLTVAGVMLAATVVETPTVSAQTFCGNVRDFPRSVRVVVFGLTDDQRLVRFRECRPDNARDIGAITGLEPDDTAIVAIDFRVQDGLLYGLGDAGGIYTIDPTTAAATPVEDAALTEELEGEEFDIDFNPAADALRIISDTGQNFRHPFSGATQFLTQVDADLNIPIPLPGVDPALGITGVAYTNNDLDPNTGTTLFDISSDADQVLIQSPPNDGVLVPTGLLTVDADATLFRHLQREAPRRDRRQQGVRSPGRGRRAGILPDQPAHRPGDPDRRVRRPRRERHRDPPPAAAEPVKPKGPPAAPRSP